MIRIFIFFPFTSYYFEIKEEGDKKDKRKRRNGGRSFQRKMPSLRQPSKEFIRVLAKEVAVFLSFGFLSHLFVFAFFERLTF